MWAVIICVALLVAVALILFPGVFYGSPPGLPATLSASCGGELQPSGHSVNPSICPVSVLMLSPGRYRVMTRDASIRELVIDFHPSGREKWEPRVLLLRSGLPANDFDLRVEGRVESERWVNLLDRQHLVNRAMDPPRRWVLSLTSGKREVRQRRRDRYTGGRSTLSIRFRLLPTYNPRHRPFEVRIFSARCLGV